MLGRFGLLFACVLGLGCAPATDTPVPAPPPSSPRTVIDEVEAPAQSVAPAEAEGPAEADPSVGAPVTGTPAVAPEWVSQEINEHYAQNDNPKRWAKRFERIGREVFDQRDPIVAALGLRKGQRIADVGAGTGLFTMELARAVGEQGTVYAVDVQPYFLDHIAQRARKEGLSNVKLVRARQDSVQLPEGSVQLVLMCDAYHHVEQPAAYLESLRRAIEPGGRLVVVDYRAVEGENRAWIVEHVRATPEQFRAEIEGAGFRFVREHEGVLEENFFYEFERP
ncbi:MAG: methyltransferase domain-containing protein [Myxococcota bacterium]